MATVGESILAYLALRSLVSDDRYELYKEYDCRVVRDYEIKCQQRKESYLWMLEKNIVKVEKESVGCFDLIAEITEEPYCNLTIDVNGIPIVDTPIGPDLDTAINGIVTQFEFYFENVLLEPGRVVVVNNRICVYAPPSWNGYEFSWEVTGCAPNASSSLENIENFSGGAEVGQLYSKFDDNCRLQSLLDHLTEEYDLACCANQYFLKGTANCDCCAEETHIPLASLTLSTQGNNMEVSIIDSLTCTGVELDYSDVTGDYVLVYEFFDVVTDPNSPIYKLSILPGSDASLAGSWTYISGLQNFTHFQNNLLIAMTGTGSLFSVNGHIQTAIFSEVKIKLTIQDSDCGDSYPVVDSYIIPYNPAVINLTETFPCVAEINASGSIIYGGTAITASTPGATCMLRYGWYVNGVELVTAEIAPNADPSSFVNWTYLSGTKNSSEFEQQFVNQIITGGSGFTFEWDMNYLASLIGNGFIIEGRLQIIQGSYPSNTASDTLYCPGTSVPLAENVVILGTLERFQTLTLSFTYNGNNPAGTHIYQWFRRAYGSSDPWLYIPGATLQDYTTTPEDEDMEITAYVKPVDNTTAIGFSTYAAARGPVLTGPFVPYDIPDTLTIMDMSQASKVISLGGSPDRVTDVYDGAWATNYHWDDSNQTPQPDYDTPGRLNFTAGDRSVFGINNSNPLPIVAGDDITVVAVVRFDPSLGTSFHYLNYYNASNYTILNNGELGIYSSAVLNEAAADPTLIDGNYRVLIWRSGSVANFDLHLDGVQILTVASHEYNWDTSNFNWGRIASQDFRGSLKRLQIIHRRISDAELAQLQAHYATLTP